MGFTELLLLIWLCVLGNAVNFTEINGFQYVDSSQYCYVFTSQLYGNPKNQSSFWFQWKDVTWTMGGQKYMRYGCATTRTTYSGWLMCVLGREECNPDVMYDNQLTLEPDSDDAAKLTTILYKNRTVLPVYVILPPFTCRRFTAIRPYPYYETPETEVTGLGWAGHCQTVIYLMDMGMTGKFTNMRIEQAAGTYMGGHDFINSLSSMVKPNYFGSIVTWQWQKHYREMAYTCRGDQCNEMMSVDRHKNSLPPFTPYYSFEHNDTPPYGRAQDTDPNLTFLDFGVSFLKRRAVEPAAFAKTALHPFLEVWPMLVCVRLY